MYSEQVVLIPIPILKGRQMSCHQIPHCKEILWSFTPECQLQICTIRPHSWKKSWTQSTWNFRLTTQKNCLFSIEEREYITTARGTFIEIVREEWAISGSPPPQPPAGPATNKRKLISVLKGTFEIWRRTKVWLTEQYLCINGRPGAPQQKKF